MTKAALAVLLALAGQAQAAPQHLGDGIAGGVWCFHAGVTVRFPAAVCPKPWRPDRVAAYSAWRPSFNGGFNGDCCWGRDGEFEWWYWREFWPDHPEATCDDVPPQGREWRCTKP